MKELKEVLERHTKDSEQQRDALISMQHCIDGVAKDVDRAIFQLGEFVRPLLKSQSLEDIHILDVIISALFSSKEEGEHISRRQAAKILRCKWLKSIAYSRRIDLGTKYRNKEVSSVHDVDSYARTTSASF